MSNKQSTNTGFYPATFEECITTIADEVPSIAAYQTQVVQMELATDLAEPLRSAWKDGSFLRRLHEYVVEERQEEYARQLVRTSSVLGQKTTAIEAEFVRV